MNNPMRPINAPFRLLSQFASKARRLDGVTTVFVVSVALSPFHLLIVNHQSPIGPQFVLAQAAPCETSRPRPPVGSANYSYTSDRNTGAKDEIPLLGKSFSDGDASRAFKLAQRENEKQIRRIRFKYFAGNKKKHAPSLQRGLDEFSKFTSPTAVQPMIEVLRGEGDDVRNWLLDHLRYDVEQPYGQAALTWLSIYDDEASMRDAARLRLTGSANPRSQFVIDQALRLADNDLVNNAALAAGKFKIIQAIPLLIATQAASSVGMTRGTGALAFVQFQKQSFFVSDLQPVVGTNSVGFDPTLSVIQEGTVMVIEDAVVEFMRPQVHQTLLDLVREDYGKPVDFGYRYNEWRNWYQQEYLSFKRAQLANAENADAADGHAGDKDGSG